MLMPKTKAGFPAPARTPRSGCEIMALDGATHARIKGLETMPPFLMNVVSDGDVCIFAGSNAGLTAGRRDPDGALAHEVAHEAF